MERRIRGPPLAPLPFQTGERCRFRNDHAYLFNGAAGLVLAVADGFALLGIRGQVAEMRAGHLLKKFLPLGEFRGDRVNALAIGDHPRFRVRDFRFTVQQREPVALGGILCEGHDRHRDEPCKTQHGGDCRDSNLHPGRNLDKTDLSRRSHEEFALGKYGPQAIVKTASG